MTQAVSNVSDRRVADGADVESGRSLEAVVGAALIIGLPTAFWMGLIELIAYVANFDYGNTERLIIGCALVGFLAVIFGCIRLSRG